jgi:hypothetical protein
MVLVFSIIGRTMHCQTQFHRQLAVFFGWFGHRSAAHLCPVFKIQAPNRIIAAASVWYVWSSARHLARKD